MIALLLAAQVAVASTGLRVEYDLSRYSQEARHAFVQDAAIGLSAGQVILGWQHEFRTWFANYQFGSPARTDWHLRPFGAWNFGWFQLGTLFHHMSSHVTERFCERFDLSIGLDNACGNQNIQYNAAGPILVRRPLMLAYEFAYKHERTFGSRWSFTIAEDIGPAAFRLELVKRQGLARFQPIGRGTVRLYGHFYLGIYIEDRLWHGRTGPAVVQRQGIALGARW